MVAKLVPLAKGFKFLEGDGLGTLEVCGGRGINKVGGYMDIHGYAFGHIVNLLCIICIQLYHFRKRPLPADADAQETVSFATKLSRYNVSITD